MLKKLNAVFEVFVFVFLMLSAALIAVNDKIALSFFDGIKLFIACILPSILPYFFITTVLSSLKITGKIANKFSPLMNKCFNQQGIVSYALFMSVLSGYPMGAKIISDLKKDNLLTDTEAVRAFALCSTSSPVFTIGSVGAIMFNNVKFGVLLFCCNFLSAITVGVIFSFYKRKETPKTSHSIKPLNADNLILDSVMGGVTSALTVGGIITLFYMFTEILLTLNLLNPLLFILKTIFKSETLSKGVTLGLFESTKGLKILSSTPCFLSLPLSATLIGFGGLSVIMQSLIFIKNAKIKTAPFLTAKILGAVISFIFGIIFSLILL